MKLWDLDDERGGMRWGEARKNGSRRRDVRPGYWQAPQQSEGIFRDGELYQAEGKLFLHARPAGMVGRVRRSED